MATKSKSPKEKELADSPSSSQESLSVINFFGPFTEKPLRRDELVARQNKVIADRSLLSRIVNVACRHGTSEQHFDSCWLTPDSEKMLAEYLTLPTGTPAGFPDVGKADIRSLAGRNFEKRVSLGGKMVFETAETEEMTDQLKLGKRHAHDVTDGAIDGYIALLETLAAEKAVGEGVKRLRIKSVKSAYVQQLISGNTAATLVDGQSTMGFGDYDLLGRCDLLVLPVNMDGHWSMILIDFIAHPYFKGKYVSRLTLFDSLVQDMHRPLIAKTSRERANIVWAAIRNDMKKYDRSKRRQYRLYSYTMGMFNLSGGLAQDIGGPCGRMILMYLRCRVEGIPYNMTMYEIEERAPVFAFELLNAIHVPLGHGDRPGGLSPSDLISLNDIDVKATQQSRAVVDDNGRTKYKMLQHVQALPQMPLVVSQPTIEPRSAKQCREPFHLAAGAPLDFNRRVHVAKEKPKQTPVAEGNESLIDSIAGKSGEKRRKTTIEVTPATGEKRTASPHPESDQAKRVRFAGVHESVDYETAVCLEFFRHYGTAAPHKDQVVFPVKLISLDGMQAPQAASLTLKSIEAVRETSDDIERLMWKRLIDHLQRRDEMDLPVDAACHEPCVSAFLRERAEKQVLDDEFLRLTTQLMEEKSRRRTADANWIQLAAEVEELKRDKLGRYIGFDTSDERNKWLKDMGIDQLQAAAAARALLVDIGDKDFAERIMMQAVLERMAKTTGQASRVRPASPDESERVYKGKSFEEVRFGHLLNNEPNEKGMSIDEANKLFETQPDRSTPRQKTAEPVIDENVDEDIDLFNDVTLIADQTVTRISYSSSSDEIIVSRKGTSKRLSSTSSSDEDEDEDEQPLTGKSTGKAISPPSSPDEDVGKKDDKRKSGSVITDGSEKSSTSRIGELPAEDAPEDVIDGETLIPDAKLRKMKPVDVVKAVYGKDAYVNATRRLHIKRDKGFNALVGGNTAGVTLEAINKSLQKLGFADEFLDLKYDAISLTKPTIEQLRTMQRYGRLRNYRMPVPREKTGHKNKVILFRAADRAPRAEPGRELNGMSAVTQVWATRAIMKQVENRVDGEEEYEEFVDTQEKPATSDRVLRSSQTPTDAEKQGKSPFDPLRNTIGQKKKKTESAKKKTESAKKKTDSAKK